MSQVLSKQWRAPVTAGCLALGLASALAWAAVPASAAPQGTPEQRAACEQDAYRLCGDAVPDADRTASCLRRHRMSLSPACRAAFSGKGARRSQGSAR
jgi:hypothetical protein